MMNQKQIDLAFNMWANDNGNKFPWQVSETNHGVLEVCNRGYAAADFRTVQGYSLQPRCLVCPTDQIKTVATNVASLRNENISYFVGFDYNATNGAACILTGDRHLMANRNPVKPGLFTYSTNSTMDWSRELHSVNSSQPYGMVSFYDGHVERIRNVDLNSAFRRQALATARYAVP